MSPQLCGVPTQDAPHLQENEYTGGVQTPTPTLADCARAWLDEREAQFASGELAYHTIISYRRTVRVICESLGTLPIEQVNRDHLRAMHGTNRFRPTVANQALSIVRRVLTEAEESGLRPRGPCPARAIRHHPEAAARRPAAPGQVLRAFMTCAAIRAGKVPPICHPTLAALFQLVALTGARPSEIRTLEWPWVFLDDEPPTLRLPRHKTSRVSGEKPIVLSPLAKGVLLSLPPTDPRWVFPSHENPGNPYNDISKPWRRVALAAGLGRCNLRDLRSGTATNMHEMGVPIEIIKETLGHRSLHTTLIYTQISPRKVHHAHLELQRAIFQRSTKRR